MIIKNYCDAINYIRMVQKILMQKVKKYKILIKKRDKIYLFVLFYKISMILEKQEYFYINDKEFNYY